ncbi:hypothetical protein H310_06338 [Aphanomyces invadans]|uniref:Amino acid permease/ SLC12A domain-containing protein n=1 Tax=Aphanomyces invadans TaxID=157072 RepID=A0A024U805_9STRA|nr:hypothetical protein H310_06338 [Aphanomyces invadans]ETW01733.1 hypothetical protein H310_06338 [Aphanomyces invadans]|eukprot:XP_008869581.1 hypothetical protein H310_06338 [Aphanomyces invadans]
MPATKVTPLRRTLLRQLSNLRGPHVHRHTSFDVWALGITIVIGGQYFSWNAGLAAGTLSYGISVVLMGVAYLCLTLSMSEMTSMLPFAGGAYGLARCTLGYYVGFLMGCCEAIEYIMYVTCSVVQLGRMLTTRWPDLAKWQFGVWFVVYAVACGGLLVGGKLFWRWNAVLALTSIGVLLVYCVGSAGKVDLAANAGGGAHFVIGGAMSLMKYHPLASWFFVGIEALNTMSNEVHNPKVTIPRGQIACMLTLLVTGASVFVVTIGLPPGMPAVATELMPMNVGFVLLFGVSSSSAALFSVPATFATIQGFILAYANIVSALACSKLLPHGLQRSWRNCDAPVFAIAGGSALSFGLCFVDYYIVGLDGILFNVCMLFACIGYTSQCIGYIYLKKQCVSLSRGFHSPFGIPGAVVSMVVWVFTMVSIIGFQDDHENSLIVALAIVAALTLYYHCFAKYRQTFSEDERRVLFPVHVAILNAAPQTHRALRGQSTSERMVMNFNPSLKKLMFVPTTLHLSTIKSATTMQLHGSKLHEDASQPPEAAPAQECRVADRASSRETPPPRMVRAPTELDLHQSIRKT